VIRQAIFGLRMTNRPLHDVDIILNIAKQYLPDPDAYICLEMKVGEHLLPRLTFFKIPTEPVQIWV
jgi:hypothetical protein